MLNKHSVSVKIILAKSNISSSNHEFAFALNMYVVVLVMF